VVVSVNYRTGAEGFAHLEGFPDNRGLLDQIAALRWVHDNVAAFGGNPHNITVFGESAGAGSIAALLAMPAAAGLFHRAAIQSLPGTYFTPELAADITASIAEETRGQHRHPVSLTDVTPPELVAATRVVTERLPHMSGWWGAVAHTPTPFSPVVDGDILPKPPWSVLASGQARDIPMFVSHVRDEFRLLAARLGPTTDDEVDQLIDNLAVTVSAERYRAEFPHLTAEQLREIALADWLFRMPTIHLADAARAGGGLVWTSALCWGFGPQGASHGLDTLLVFGTADADGEITAAGSAAVQEARMLSELMRTEFLAFAATGNPGWPRYEPPHDTTRIYDTTPSVEPYPEQRSQTIWRDHHFEAINLPKPT